MSINIPAWRRIFIAVAPAPIMMATLAAVVLFAVNACLAAVCCIALAAAIHWAALTLIEKQQHRIQASIRERLAVDAVAPASREADRIFVDLLREMTGMMAILPGENVVARHEETRLDGTHVETITITNALVGGVTTITKEWKR